MSSVRLEAYLRLASVLMDLDETDDPLADRLRDAMDPLWYALTDEEHASLDAREIVAVGSATLRMPLGETFCFAPQDPEPASEKGSPSPILDWELDAA